MAYIYVYALNGYVYAHVLYCCWSKKMIT